MAEAPRSIAAVQGASSVAIQDLLRAFVERQRPYSSIVGVLEEPPDETHAARRSNRLRSLNDHAVYPLFQDLGLGSAACGLDASGVVSACHAVSRDIQAGCDLVILSKFGKLEADRSGLADAFKLAIEARVPILTSVSPRYIEAWERFAAPLFVLLAPDARQLDLWWRQARRAQ